MIYPWFELGGLVALLGLREPHVKGSLQRLIRRRRCSMTVSPHVLVRCWMGCLGVFVSL
jgi:hypothetical protein